MKTGFIQGFKFRGISMTVEACPITRRWPSMGSKKGISTTGVVPDPLYGIVAPKMIVIIVQSPTVCFRKEDSTVAGLA